LTFALQHQRGKPFGGDGHVLVAVPKWTNGVRIFRRLNTSKWQAKNQANRLILLILLTQKARPRSKGSLPTRLTKLKRFANPNFSVCFIRKRTDLFLSFPYEYQLQLVKRPDRC